MVRKALLLLVLLVLAMVLYQWQTNPTVEVEESKEPSTSKDTSMVVESDKKTTSSAETIKQQQRDQKIMADQIEALMLESTQPVFNDDLFIETQVFQAVFLGCDLFTSGFIYRSIGNSETGKTALKNAKKRCGELRQAHPRMYFISSEWNAAKDIPSPSLWGRKIKAMQELRGDERKVADAELFKHALTQKEAHWMVLAMMNINNADHIFPYQQLLNTVDSKYLDKVVHLAVGQRICQLGDNHFCGPQGILMLEPCFENNKMCGLDFKTWYQKAILPGMKKDVDLVLNHYEAFVNGANE